VLALVDDAPPMSEPEAVVDAALLDVLADELPPAPDGVPVLADALVLVALVVSTALLLVVSLVLEPVVDVAAAASVTSPLSLACSGSSLPQALTHKRARIDPSGATRV